ncbi:MAG: hypothetical protein K9J37_00330 [Saprospiraceae bacterium]|nr:hypothetical protein [Saprospiraceae bacterium]MCF8248319.1 hypothetical protein [Saprospiraceae bacterium]MCF8280242.1 hypothetical protein [Bacteroidales bacterium]MCF8309847.1 hypothetical protein [Saprospiraceae bacterium]MCF8438822.1 hypothetical protein [Saprospiraceae bacterium]
MKHFLLLCLICTALTQVNGQLSITASTTRNLSVEWQVVTENFITHRRTDFLRYGTSGVIDYVFSMKNETIRFRPAVQFMLANSVFKQHYFQASAVGVQGNIEVALSPKLNKEGKKKPIRPFLQLSPGISLVSFRYEHPKDDVNNIIVLNKSHSISPNIGASLFFELKLSPLLTIAPAAGLRYYYQLQWKGFTESVTKGKMSGTYDHTNWKQLNFGLRVGLNLK